MPGPYQISPCRACALQLASPHARLSLSWKLQGPACCCSLLAHSRGLWRVGGLEIKNQEGRSWPRTRRLSVINPHLGWLAALSLPPATPAHPAHSWPLHRRGLCGPCSLYAGGCRTASLGPKRAGVQGRIAHRLALSALGSRPLLGWIPFFCPT
jgi:hypothetical protein